MKIDSLRKKGLNLSGFVNINNVHEIEKGGVYVDSPLNRKLGRVGQPYKKSDKQEEKIPSKIPGSTDEITKMSAKGLRNAILGVNNIATNIKDNGDHFKVDFDSNNFNTHGEMSPKITQIKKFLEGMGASVVVGKNSLKVFKNDKKSSTSSILSNSTTLKNAKGDRLNAIIDYAGFDISKDASDEEKRNKITEKYIQSAELKGSSEEIADQLDELIEDALSDVSPKSNDVKEILSTSTTLGKAEGKRLDAIIKYADINVDKNASDAEKRNKIADFYIKSSQLEGSNEEIANQLDEIVEDALSDYVPSSEDKKYPTPKKDPYFKKMDEIKERESKIKDNKNIQFPLKNGKVSEKELKDFLLNRYPNNKKEIDSFIDNQIMPDIKRYKDGNYPVIRDKIEFLTTFEYYNLNK